ncbi:uncharacterized protein GGS22DRAFT_151742 [Annulohypoxylon maeteangense]|uniref:uncharacterized protein n=1 Tax=Annulohypoxylon maeteangense TaxID=1927788 RepID=UPI0020073564|nr:uncharacterized protein GGS22DRAFT_151742 [Annulohypoxylon maeteangense]KAI0890754.1 hypothetical protein GGS22DRAFT_151742 [Annulohypoxylon maeteangense]
MAEALGVIASSIAVAQVAGKAAGTVIKLKRLWDEVQDIPENVADLMEQIDCLDPALWEAEQHFIQNQLSPCLWNDTAAIRSAKYCRKALRKLTDVADDLASQINSKRRAERGISRVKVLLKKDRLRDLERRLESAVRLLQLAQQGYLVTLVKLQPDIIASKLMLQLDTVRRPNSLCANDTEMNDKETKHQHRSTDWSPRSIEAAPPLKKGRLRVWKESPVFGVVDIASTSDGVAVDIQPPWWLTGILDAWSFNIVKSYSGWKFHLQSYPIRPNESLIFDVVRWDDTEKLQAMFRTGDASPFDRNEIGSSILHIAVQTMSVNVIRFLKEMSLDIDCQDGESCLAIDYIPWVVNYTIPSDPHMWSEYISLMSSELFMTRDVEDYRGYCRCIPVANADDFRKLQSITCPAHDETPFYTRLFRVEVFSIKLRAQFKFETFQYILGLDLDKDLDAVYDFDSYPTRLSHIIANIISALDIQPTMTKTQEGEIEKWINFASSIYRGSNINSLSSMALDAGKFKYLKINGTIQLTPLLYIILSGGHHALFGGKKQFERLLKTDLRHWFSFLKTIGTDLIEYGREEMRILCTNNLKYLAIFKRLYFRKNLDMSEFSWLGYLRLISFQFGPDVDDWKVLWNEPTDEFAGDFWNMVEDPILSIPGAWYDVDCEG